MDRNELAAAEGLRRGAYIISDVPKKKPAIILIASGSEVSLIIAVAKKLRQQKIPVRIVSMPSWELFAAQSKQYRDSVLPPTISRRLVVEAGVSQGWERYVGEHGAIISVETFGASAPGETIMDRYGFSVKNIYACALRLLRRGPGKN